MPSEDFSITTRATEQRGSEARPKVLRLLQLTPVSTASGYLMRAQLFHETATQTVNWTCSKPAAHLQTDMLVSPRACLSDWSRAGEVRISHLVRVQYVEPDVDLMATVPDSWIADRSLLHRFSSLWQRMPRHLRAWFNALFWHEPERLRGYVTAPASMKHHHNQASGLLRHSVDCAERALALASDDHTVNFGVLILAALLHDLGKAQEYRWYDFKQSWGLSTQGALLGHKLAGLVWLAAARVMVSQHIDEMTATSVYHAITACHAADYVGMRSPRTPEAIYLASVDALSGMTELIHRHANSRGGFGSYHDAFRGGPFTLPAPVAQTPTQSQYL